MDAGCEVEEERLISSNSGIDADDDGKGGREIDGEWDTSKFDKGKWHPVMEEGVMEYVGVHNERNPFYNISQMSQMVQRRGSKTETSLTKRV